VAAEHDTRIGTSNDQISTSSVFPVIKSLRTGHFGTASELKPSHTLHDRRRMKLVVVESSGGCQLALLPAGIAKTMKTKTWTVIANTGKQVDLQFGLEKKTVQKPTHISAKEFVHWLAPDSHIDDVSLESLFKL